MKIVRRRIWSRFLGLVAVISVTSFAAALALAAYEPNMARGVRVLGSFLQRIPVRVVHRKAAPVAVPVAPTPVELPAVTPPAMPATEATTVATPVATPVAAPEEWDEEDELHGDDDEMPSAPSETP